MIKIDLNPPIPKLPKFEDKTLIDLRYLVILPYVSIHIYWDKQVNELVYEIEEPVLNEQEKAMLKEIEQGMLELTNVNLLENKSQEAVIEYLENTAKLIIDELGLKVTEEQFYKFFYYIYRDFIGLNEIEPLMRDYFIEDIECNGIGTPIYIVHRIYRNMRTSLIYRNMDKLVSFVEKLAQRCGRYISYATPLLDGSLPDGSRVNATYSTDVTSRGPTFTIRKFTKIPWTPIQLIAFGTLSPEMLAYLWLLVEHKCNILICGGTGSGKTTLLNAVAFFIPPEARVVSIEDTRELKLERENWLPSVARTGIGVGGIGEVDLFALLKASFRQNPDYVIVGEVRGKEAFVLFQGMASGHASIATIHADSVQTVIQRLETPPINLSPTLVNSLDVVAVMTHATVHGHETRKLREITEVIEVKPDGTAITNTPFLWNAEKDVFYFSLKSKVLEKIAQKAGLSMQELQKEFYLRTKLIFELYRNKVFDFSKVQELINLYYNNKQAVLKKFVLIEKMP